MRPVTILSWLALVCTQAYGMIESIPNMENRPVLEDATTLSAALDAKALSKCPYDDRDLFNDRGTYYRIYYHLADDACDESADLNPGGQPLYTPKGCIQACTDNPKCKRAIWPEVIAANTKGACYLRPYTEIAGPVPLGTGCKGWSSAHQQ